MRKKTAALVAIALGILMSSHAQTEGLGSWSVANIRYSFNDKWLMWSEFQLRSYKFYNNFFTTK